jgi:DNA-binding PadR family transcriptional regulator
MGRDGLLGELEHQVMLALLRLGDEAYTAPIAEELEERTGRRTTVAAVYIVLRRLEEKGLVDSKLREPGPEGGRDRRYFEVTGDGMERLRLARRAYASLWDGLDTLLEPGR